ncbi:carbon monoxide dehydrogenase subunit G family protein [Paraburkholderia xenovorans LB400]|uniref:Carbon monoxide dehydrogenase, CoxG subunit n=1 Tax=Paraburkholderia xenovorans (strain LB400) TaxID=266265 RepID=Q13IY0_PARXL|nr:SRPBCC family protein [Paraburkholderia xenovorans]ABE35959.1 Putative carbon monoxide dehydrogenase, CoxG subunit [Paraburkholderia xenovorans LB400]AIP34501.1 carbon monoxide dehydrogenase subunit G family protein [Paraburkholderia xenovorans LB400]
MKVVLEKVFPLAATADSAWQLMQDIEAVAGCMPGAKITERVDATHYKGTITVRLGPATMSFKGDIEVLDLDRASRRLHLTGKGADASGTSAASMDLVAAVRATGESCELTGKSEVTMSGKAASLGGRLMGPVSEQMLRQFVANFAARLPAVQAQQTALPGGAAQPQTQPPAATPDTAAPPSELNGLALAWAVVRDWLRGIFSRKTA